MNVLNMNTIFSCKGGFGNFGLETTNFLFQQLWLQSVEFLVTCTKCSWPQTCQGVVIAAPLWVHWWLVTNREVMHVMQASKQALCLAHFFLDSQKRSDLWEINITPLWCHLLG